MADGVPSGFHPAPGNRIALAQRLSSCVIRLLSIVCPPAISGCIRGIVVDAIKTPTSRPVAHVPVECLERSPFIAHCDAPPAVVRKARVIGVGCALNHVQPSDVGGRVRHAVRLPSGYRLGDPVMPARRGFSCGKITDVRPGKVSALALAHPNDFLARMSVSMDGGQLTKLFAGEI